MVANAADSPPQEDKREEKATTTRKPYKQPEIIHELELETRAGSPLAVPDPIDPLQTK